MAPRMPPFWLKCANALMDLEGNVARAMALADRAIAINPGLARAWFIGGLARLLDHDGQMERSSISKLLPGWTRSLRSMTSSART